MEYLSELMKRELINISDGSKLGYIDDIEIDLGTGKIVSLIVKDARRGLSLFNKKDSSYRVLLSELKKIGDETILVEKKDLKRNEEEEK